MAFLLNPVRGGLTAAAFTAVLAASCVFGQSSAPVPPSPSTKALLPSSLAGWTEEGASKTGTSPAAADTANADALNEYVLKEFSEGTYRRGAGAVSLRAMRFADATGAYGAFTFYRKPDMRPDAIGNNGAGDAREIVFWSGVTVVDATFDSSTAQIPAFLKALNAALPPPTGATAVAPSLPGYLPAGSLDKTTVRYAIGPSAYTRGGGVLPANAINFSQDAEVVTAQYSALGGNGTLTIIEYPTPQMAIHSEQALNTLLKGSLPATLQQSSAEALGVRRSGPIVAVTSGNFSSAEAQALLAQVKYQADVTWNRGGDNSKREVKNAAAMLLGIAYLTAVLAACAIVLGIFLGGGRALWRIMHGKPASAAYEVDFIALNLSGWMPGSTKKMP